MTFSSLVAFHLGGPGPPLATPVPGCTGCCEEEEFYSVFSNHSGDSDDKEDKPFGHLSINLN